MLERTAREFVNNSKTAIRTRVCRFMGRHPVLSGQPHKVSVSVPPGPVECLYADFERRHERLFGTKLKNDAEIVNIRVTVTRQVQRLSAPQFLNRTRSILRRSANG